MILNMYGKYCTFLVIVVCVVGDEINNSIGKVEKRFKEFEIVPDVLKEAPTEFLEVIKCQFTILRLLTSFVGFLSEWR